MTNIFKDLLVDTCLVHQDDIIIYSTSLQEHLRKICKVFSRLRQHNFKIQLDKSEFLQKQVNCLGHVLSSEGVRPNSDKVKSVKEFPITTIQKKIKSFLGLVGYYRKFIPNFAAITKP